MPHGCTLTGLSDDGFEIAGGESIRFGQVPSGTTIILTEPTGLVEAESVGPGTHLHCSVRNNLQIQAPFEMVTLTGTPTANARTIGFAEGIRFIEIAEPDTARLTISTGRSLEKISLFGGKIRFNQSFHSASVSLHETCQVSADITGLQRVELGLATLLFLGGNNAHVGLSVDGAGSMRTVAPLEQCDVAIGGELQTTGLVDTAVVAGGDVVVTNRFVSIGQFLEAADREQGGPITGGSVFSTGGCVIAGDVQRADLAAATSIECSQLAGIPGSERVEASFSVKISAPILTCRSMSGPNLEVKAETVRVGIEGGDPQVVADDVLVRCSKFESFGDVGSLCISGLDTDLDFGVPSISIHGSASRLRVEATEPERSGFRVMITENLIKSTVAVDALELTGLMNDSHAASRYVNLTGGMVGSHLEVTGDGNATGGDPDSEEASSTITWIPEFPDNAEFRLGIPLASMIVASVGAGTPAMSLEGVGVPDQLEVFGALNLSASGPRAPDWKRPAVSPTTDWAVIERELTARGVDRTTTVTGRPLVRLHRTSTAAKPMLGTSLADAERLMLLAPEGEVHLKVSGDRHSFALAQDLGRLEISASSDPADSEATLFLASLNSTGDVTEIRKLALSGFVHLLLSDLRIAEAECDLAEASMSTLTIRRSEIGSLSGATKLHVGSGQVFASKVRPVPKLLGLISEDPHSGVVSGFDLTSVSAAALQHAAEQIALLEPEATSLIDWAKSSGDQQRKSYRASDAQKATGLAIALGGKAVSGGSYSATRWAAAYLHHQSLPPWSPESVVRRLHRMLGYGARPIPPILTWLALSAFSGLLAFPVLACVTDTPSPSLETSYAEVSPDGETTGTSETFEPSSWACASDFSGYLHNAGSSAAFPLRLLRVEIGTEIPFVWVRWSLLRHFLALTIGVSFTFVLLALRNYLRTGLES